METGWFFLNFVPNTSKEQLEMLKESGVSSFEKLFADIPSDKRLNGKQLSLPSPLPELELVAELKALGEKNLPIGKLSSFLGAGCYNHFIPSAVWHLVGRSEFYTAYTPYQPEISQGMLQSIFEFQSMVCGLFGMDAANASHYDGASALSESVLMGVWQTGRKEIVYSKAVNPDYLDVVKTYATAHSLKLVEIGFENGVTDLTELKSKVSENTASVIVQSPNFFGCIEDLSGIEKIVHSKNAFFCVGISDPTCLGLLKPPGEFNADVVSCDGQPFGIPMSFGGPFVGMMATKMDYVRRLPGRIVGKTVDSDGKDGFIMTLQAREQHIRREKATSNICTNQALFALAATIHLSLLGKNGLKELAELNLKNSHYLCQKISEISGFKIAFSKPFYNEFVVKCPNSKKILSELQSKGIVAGIDLGKYFKELENHLLVCVTEMNSKKQVDEFIEALKAAKF